LNKIENAMKTQNSINNIDKNTILSNTEKTFEKMTNVLQELKPLETVYTSKNEENFF
jgi:hypothetical protein